MPSMWKNCGPGCFAVLLLSLITVPATAQTSRDSSVDDWSRDAVTDLAFIRRAIEENHPGPVDAENPAFLEWFDEGYALARELAARARTPTGYYFALQRYVVGFQDGHLWLSTPGLNIPWFSPGFVMKRAAGSFVVATVQRPDDAPAVGSRLISCDGVEAETLARDRLGRFLFPLEPEARFYSAAPYLLLDAKNPFAPRPLSCVFAVADNREKLDLHWQPAANIGSLVADALTSVRLDNEMRTLDDGYWISVPRLLMSGENAQAEALREIIARIELEADRMRTSRFIVFDLRSNTGGSSTWVREIASLLWGEAHVRAHRRGSDAIDHRVSEGNYEHFRHIRDEFFKDPGQPAYDYVHALVDGLAAGIDRGDLFFRYTEADEELVETRRSVEEPDFSATVFVLTDHSCASACLDAVDLLLPLGAIHIGRATSGDTPYLEVRSEPLPSGHGEVVFPTKVYRGRPRGANEPYVPAPDYTWSGRMDDTAALEIWIGELLREHRAKPGEDS